MLKKFNKRPLTITAFIVGVVGILGLFVAITMTLAHLLQVINGVKINGVVKEVNNNEIVVEYIVRNSTFTFKTNKSHYELGDSYLLYYNKKANYKAYSDDQKYVFMSIYFASFPLFLVGLIVFINNTKKKKSKELALKGSKTILKAEYVNSHFYLFKTRLGRLMVEANGKKYYSDLIYPIDKDYLPFISLYLNEDAYYLDLDSVFNYIEQK